MKRPHSLISLLLIFLFVTCDDDSDTLDEPQVLTNEVTRITSTGAVFSGELQLGTKEPIVHHGFVWNTDPDVTINFAENVDLGPAAKSGNFSAEINAALEPNARYYVRAYTISKQGTVDHITYGNEVTFISLGAEAPAITEITPPTANMGDTLFITGKNFSSIPEKNIVQFGSITAEVFQANANKLKVKVPNNLDASTVKISVSVYGNISEAANNFRLNPPVIDDVNPREGYAGNYFSVYGNNFINGHTQLFFGDKEIPIQSLSPSVISTYLPYDIKSGENTVKVKVFDQETSAISSFLNLSPEITSVTPLEVTFGDTITVTGTGLSKGSAYAYISDTYASIIENSGNQLKIIIPSDLYYAENYLRLTVNGLSTQYSKALKLKAPIITDISPAKGAAGTEVTINGKYFSDSYWRNSVFFNGYSANIISTSKTQIVATVPYGLTGFSDLQVTVGYQSATLPGAFEVVLPEIVDYSPKKGTKGTVVTITGSNFSSNASVAIGSASCEVISATTDEMQVRITSDVYESSGLVSMTIGGTTVYGLEQFAFTWTRKNSPWYYGRLFAIGFSYQNKGYFGLGYDYSTRKDINEYDVANNYWASRTSISYADATVGSNPISFLIDGVLYIYSGDNNFTNAKVLQYDVQATTWAGVANIPEKRTAAIAFAANGKGYLGLGLNENSVYTKNFYEYDPGDDSWTDVGDFPGDERTDATVMDIDGEIVMGLGQGETSALKDLYRFDSSNKTWTRLNDFPSFARSGCATFTVNGIAYLVGGRDESGSYINEIWAYDLSNDSWQRKSDFVGNRFGAVAFALGGKGYVGSGYDANGYSYTGDLWEYDPSVDE